MTKKDRVQIVISIHALREEGDRSGACLPLSRHDFYPRPPRGGRLCIRHVELHQGTISIHALREEGDLTAAAAMLIRQYFYPRPPRGGRRPQYIVV